MTAEQQFYIIRGEPQVIRLARRQGNNPVTLTGSYCCTVPTDRGGEMTLCANLGESIDSHCLPSVFYVSHSAFHEFMKPSLLYHVDNLHSPLAVAVPCSDNLPAPTNGGITYAGGSTNNRPVNATATYSCIGDYTLFGVSVRTCQSDGEWGSSLAPVCQRKK